MPAGLARNWPGPLRAQGAVPNRSRSHRGRYHTDRQRAPRDLEARGQVVSSSAVIITAVRGLWAD